MSWSKLKLTVFPLTAAPISSVRIVDTDNKTIVTAYECKIDELEKSKRIATQQLQNQSKPKHAFDEIFELRKVHAIQGVRGDFHAGKVDGAIGARNLQRTISDFKRLE